MFDLVSILATLLLFGLAHLYAEACDRLKAKPRP